MAIPSSDKAVGQSGHTTDHNSITAELTSHAADIASRVVQDTLYVNVRDYGAEGDGTTDDYQAFVDAGTVAEGLTQGGLVGVSLYLPPGTYRLNSTLDWGNYSIVGAGQRATQIVWGGATTGTVITTVDSAHKRIEEVNFRSTGSGAVNRPQCWVDISADSLDWGATIRRSSFGNLSATGEACIKIGQVINGHFTDLRFDNGNGYCIKIEHTNAGSRSFKLDGFTVDSSTAAGGGTFDGFLHVVMAGVSSQLGVELANARIETNLAADWSATAALVVVDEASAGVLGLRPLDLTLRNLQTQIPAAAGRSVLRQTTTGTASGSMLVALNCEFSGLSDVLTGSWSSGVPIPAMPHGGTVGFWVSGRQNSTPTNTNFVQVPRLAVGSDDTNLYRSAADVLKTDDSLYVGADFRHLGSNLGFYNVTAVARPSAYTQTYSTADKTHAAPTAATLSMADGAGTNDNTIGAITADASVIAAFQELVDENNKLVADLADTKQLLNAVIDDLQALGLFQ